MISMLLLLILHILGVMQGEAFPNRHMRSYGGNEYNPFEDTYGALLSEYGQVQPDFQRYSHNYKWSPMQSPAISQPIQNNNPYHNYVENPSHVWHFMDPAAESPRIPYADPRHEEFVFDPLIKTETISDEYEMPVVVEALVKKNPPTIREEEYEQPVVVEALVKKSKPMKNHYKIHTGYQESFEQKENLSHQKNIKTKPTVYKTKFEEPFSHDKKPILKEKPQVYKTHVVKEKFPKPHKYQTQFEAEEPFNHDKKPIKENPQVYKTHVVKERFPKPHEYQTQFEAEEPFSHDKKPIIKENPQVYKTQFEAEEPFSHDKKPIIKENPQVYKTQFEAEEPFSHDKKPIVKENPHVYKTHAVKEKFPKPHEYQTQFEAEEPFSHDKKPIVKEKVSKNGMYKTPVVEVSGVLLDENLVSVNPVTSDENSLFKEEFLLTDHTDMPLKERDSLEYDEYDYDLPDVVDSIDFAEFSRNNFDKNRQSFPHEISLEEVKGVKSSHEEQDEFQSNSKDSLIANGQEVVDTVVPEVKISNRETPGISGFSDSKFELGRDDFDEFENGDLGSAIGLDSRSVREDTSSSILDDPEVMSLIARIQVQEQRKYKSCITRKNETGNCMPFQICSVSTVTGSIDELLRNVCLIDDVSVGICCPEFPVETVRVDWGKFEKSKDEDVLEDKNSEIAKECGKLPTAMKDGESWPWMASLVSTNSDKVFCGGALISNKYVLTAAHCTTKLPRNQILVRLGNAELDSEPDFKVVEIKRHAAYDPRTMKNDISLLKLSRKVKLGNSARLVCLAEDSDFVGESATLLRWKGNLGDIENVESLQAISNEDCRDKRNIPTGDSILCAESKSEETGCNAESGAPLILDKDGKYQVIGILTWNRNDCDGRFPTVFTRVSSYNKWIQKHAS